MIHYSSAINVIHSSWNSHLEFMFHHSIEVTKSFVPYDCLLISFTITNQLLLFYEQLES